MKLLVICVMGFVWLQVAARNPVQQGNYVFGPTGNFYKIHTKVATWHEAKLKCEGEMAYLAIINSDVESRFLRHILIQHPDLDLTVHNSILLGFHDLTTEGDYVTIFDEPLESTGYVEWARWNPDNYGDGEDCGAMNSQGRLNDVPCDLKLPYFCEGESPSDKDNKVPSDEPTEGPVQYTVYELYPKMGSYKLHTEAATWREAMKMCEKETAHLAIINSLEESRILKDILDRHKYIDLAAHNSVLLGFNDLAVEGDYVTIFDKPLESTGYVEWAEWNPDNYRDGEDCGAMNSLGRLNDVPCDLTLPYFCERQLPFNQHNKGFWNKIKHHSTKNQSPSSSKPRRASLASVARGSQPLLLQHSETANVIANPRAGTEVRRENMAIDEGDITAIDTDLGE